MYGVVKNWFRASCLNANTMLPIMNDAKGFSVGSPAVIKEILRMRGMGFYALPTHCLYAEEIARLKKLLKPVEDQLSSASIGLAV